MDSKAGTSVEAGGYWRLHARTGAKTSGAFDGVADVRIATDNGHLSGRSLATFNGPYGATDFATHG